MDILIRNYVIVCLLALLIGVSCLFCSATATDKDTLYARFMDHLGAALIVVGGIGICEKVLSERHLIGEFTRICKVKESILEFGIEEATLEIQRLSVAKFLTESTELTLVFNDGSKWISFNFEVLQSRFSSASHKLTELFVVNPDGLFLPALASKCGDDPNRVKEKIERAIADIKRLFEEAGAKGNLRIYYMPHFPTQTIFLGTNECAITLYTASSKRLPVPLLMGRNVSKRDLYSFIGSDVEELRTTSTLVFERSNPDP